MPNNKFIVDFGPFQLTEEQRNKIDSEIQKTVTTVITEFKFQKKIKFSGISEFEKGPDGGFTGGFRAAEIEHAD
ncbi:MAG: hypothetical protein JWO03_3458 [Bacteroidetes bacterium]|nr:hypothetical protein [Bacteroidota bacterium]